MAGRIQSLQALRGIGFLLIFLSHCTFIQAFSGSWGGIGVSIFVVLSGFVVTLGHEDKDFGSNLKAFPYMWKRICKIFPLHILMLCIRLAFDYMHSIETSAPVVLLNVTMLKSFVPIRDVYYSLGGATWYLTLIWFFALITPFLLKILKKAKRGDCMHIFAAILIFRIIWIYVWHTSDISQWMNYINPFFRATDYFLGMILGANSSALKSKIAKSQKYYMGLSFAVWIIFVSYVTSLSVTTVPWYTIYLRTPLSLGLILLFLCSNYSGKLFRKGIYENPLFIYIGNISLELFLTHIHVRNYVGYIFRKVGFNNNILQLIVIFVISVLVSQIYRNVDALVRKRIRKHKAIH